MKTIKGNLVNDTAVIAQKASDLKTLPNEMVEFFPEGSNQAPSETLPAIWANFEDFRAKMVANAKTAPGLKSFAQSGVDQSAMIEGFKVLGTTCKDCHNDYKE